MGDTCEEKEIEELIRLALLGASQALERKIQRVRLAYGELERERNEKLK